MEQIAELERRISAALDRIGRGIGALSAPAPAGADETVDEAVAVAGVPPSLPPVAPGGDLGGELARLTEALETEQGSHAQTQDRLRSVTKREARTQAGLQAEIDRVTRLLDEQGLELQRMRLLVVQLRDQLRQQREAAERGLADPQAIDRALHAEMEALRATRLAEVSEMDEILAELSALVSASGAPGVALKPQEGGADA